MKETDSYNTQTNLIFGIRPLKEAIESGREIDRIFIQKGLSGDTFGELLATLQENKLHYKQVPVEKLNRLTRKNHQGVVAFMSPITFHSLESVVEDALESTEAPLFMLLDRVTDVRNFGAIVRTAECAGVRGVIIPQSQTAPINGDAMKTSTGALSRIPIIRVPHLLDAIYHLQGSGIQVLACTEKTQDSLYTPDYTKPTAIVMGSEEDGIQPNLMKVCDARTKIPLMGEIGSLNVSVASGVILYEVVRQRTQL